MDLNFLKEDEKIPPVALPPQSPPKVKNIGKELTEKIKSLIFWTGLICSIISAVAYLLIVIIMSVGFRLKTSFESNLVFAGVTAFIGVLISQFLKLQGIAFAKNEPAVKEVWEQFYKRKTPERKYQSLTMFWVKSLIFDVCFKVVSVGIISIGTVYIFIEASGDIMRIFMALFNLTLFSGFGMMSLTQAYDFTREQHVAWMQNQIKEKKEQENVKKTESVANGGADIQVEQKKESMAQAVVPNSQVVVACDSNSVLCADDKELDRKLDGNNPIA